MMLLGNSFGFTMTKIELIFSKYFLLWHEMELWSEFQVKVILVGIIKFYINLFRFSIIFKTTNLFQYKRCLRIPKKLYEQKYIRNSRLTSLNLLLKLFSIRTLFQQDKPLEICHKNKFYNRAQISLNDKNLALLHLRINNC